MLDLAARRYGINPAALLRLPPHDFAVTVSVAMRADELDFDLRSRDWWHLMILEVLGVKVPKLKNNRASADDWVTL